MKWDDMLTESCGQGSNQLLSLFQLVHQPRRLKLRCRFLEMLPRRRPVPAVPAHFAPGHMRVRRLKATIAQFKGVQALGKMRFCLRIVGWTLCSERLPPDPLGPALGKDPVACSCIFHCRGGKLACLIQITHRQGNFAARGRIPVREHQASPHLVGNLLRRIEELPGAIMIAQFIF